MSFTTTKQKSPVEFHFSHNLSIKISNHSNFFGNGCSICIAMKQTQTRIKGIPSTKPKHTSQKFPREDQKKWRDSWIHLQQTKFSTWQKFPQEKHKNWRKGSIHPQNQPEAHHKKFHKKNHKNQRNNSIHPSTHKTASARSPNSHNKKTRDSKGWSNYTKKNWKHITKITQEKQHMDTLWVRIWRKTGLEPLNAVRRFLQSSGRLVYSGKLNVPMDGWCCCCFFLCYRKLC